MQELTGTELQEVNGGNSYALAFKIGKMIGRWMAS